MNYTYEEISKTSRDFRDHAGDLLRSDYNTFNTYLNFFRGFCENNEVIKDILKPIKENQFNTQDWYDNAVQQKSSFIGTGDATLPSNKLDALTAIYDLLWSKNPLDNLILFGQSTMFKKNYTEQLRIVNDKITNFFIRYIIRELEDKIDLIKPQNMQNVQNWHINAPSNIAPNSQNINQTINQNNIQIQSELEALRKEITSSDEINESEKASALDTVDLIEEEVNKQEPNPGRVKKFTTLLPDINNVTTIASNIANMVASSGLM